MHSNIEPAGLGVMNSVVGDRFFRSFLVFRYNSLQFIPVIDFSIPDLKFWPISKFILNKMNFWTLRAIFTFQSRNFHLLNQKKMPSLSRYWLIKKHILGT